ncbi:MAG: hypothetical protein IKG18_02895 [Atopobiaceae bacterium]|nr:hypothetical protein [Atopobiaceae bacterium]MBR3313067.1 hypothetical protein [Atopobiaceae bacterium]
MEFGRYSKAHRIRDGANVVDAKSVRVTLSMTATEREALREIAKGRGTTVSGLIQSWIDERCDVVPAVADPRVGMNVRQRMDGLVMLGCLADECAACAFFDPQYRGLPDWLDYGNEGARQIGRASLAQMGDEMITAFVRELDRVVVRSGYVFLWVDKFHLVEGDAPWLEGTDLRAVDLITWDKGRIGMEWRSRHVSEYLVVLQKRPLHAARTWRDHAIPDVWEERAEKAHPHSKPVGLQERLIRAVTQPGELVVDPAAGGYSVLEACVRCDRNFVGCDVEFGEERDDG